MKKLNNKQLISILTAVVLLLLLFLDRAEVRNTIIEHLGGYTKREVITKIDTLPSKIDTIYLPSKEKVIKVPILQPIITYKDTIIYKESNKKQVIDSTLYYSNKYEDNYIKGKINTKIDLKDCNIIEQGLVYNRKDSIIIRETLPIIRSVESTLSKSNKSHFGMGINITNKNSLGIGGIYQTKNNLQFQINYSILEDKKYLNKENSNYNTISIGIYKLF